MTGYGIILCYKKHSIRDKPIFCLQTLYFIQSLTYHETNAHSSPDTCIINVIAVKQAEGHKTGKPFLK